MSPPNPIPREQAFPDDTSPSVSQWDCIRQNLGEWRGSFTQFSPTGEWLQATPSLLTLVEDRPDEHMQLTLVRTPAGEAPKTTAIEFGAPGPAPYVVFFPSGAFSQGPLQRRGWSDFGAELALNCGGRRLRSVQLYDSDLSGHSSLRYLTLIHEHRVSTRPATARESADLPDDLLADPASDRALSGLSVLTGMWAGPALFQPADLSEPICCQSHYQLVPEAQSDPTQTWHCHSKIVTPTGHPLLTETHTVTQSTRSNRGQRLHNAHWQLLFLPGGAVCTVPLRLSPHSAFTLEIAWLLAPNHRQRLIRQYDENGNWVGLFFTTESRQL